MERSSGGGDWMDRTDWNHFWPEEIARKTAEASVRGRRGWTSSSNGRGPLELGATG